MPGSMKWEDERRCKLILNRKIIKNVYNLQVTVTRLMYACDFSADCNRPTGVKFSATNCNGATWR